MKFESDIKIQSIPENMTFTIRFNEQNATLPRATREKIDRYWHDQCRENPNLRNGEVFTVIGTQKTATTLEVELKQTDYAHYLYSDRHVGELGRRSVRIIHSAALVVTTDNKLVFGSMGPQTSRHGTIQCCGGGLDRNDIRDGIVDIEHNTAKELGEELGIDPYDTDRVASFRPAYLKSGGPRGKMTVIYEVCLRETASEFLAAYAAFTDSLTRRGKEPEFGEIYYLERERQVLEKFASEHKERLDEYMMPLLRSVVDE